MSALYTVSCSCGWMSPPRVSVAAAGAVKALHSCDTYRARIERADRVEQRRSHAGPTRECTCPIARHQHGTRAAYVADRCRCRPCKDASSAYELRRTRNLAYGRAAMVDAAPVREHVLALLAAGVGMRQVVEHAGISLSAVQSLLRGKRGRPVLRVTKLTAARLLGLDLTAAAGMLANGALVDGTGSVRRVRALVACGWSIAQIAERLGHDRQTLDRALRGHQVRASTERAITTLYNALWDVPPPQSTRPERIAATRARNHARAHGWAPPVAWDDEEIDDANAMPAQTSSSPSSPEQQCGDGVRSSLRVDEIEFLLDTEPWTLMGLADRLGVGRSAVEHACARAGRRDLLERMKRNAIARKHAAA